MEINLKVNLKDMSDKALFNMAESLINELSERSDKCSIRIDNLLQAHRDLDEYAIGYKQGHEKGCIRGTYLPDLEYEPR